MGFYERIIGSERPKLSPHLVAACVGERVRGQMTAAEAKSGLGLSTAEASEFETLVTKSTEDALITPTVVEQVLMLGEGGVAPSHTVAAVKSRLGV